MKITFSELSDEQRSHLRNIYHYIDKLKEFSQKVNRKLFIYLFEEQLGNHLSDLYFLCNRDIIVFLSKVDVDVKTAIFYNIEYNKSLYAYC